MAQQRPWCAPQALVGALGLAVCVERCAVTVSVLPTLELWHSAWFPCRLRTLQDEVGSSCQQAWLGARGRLAPGAGFPRRDGVVRQQFCFLISAGSQKLCRFGKRSRVVDIHTVVMYGCRDWETGRRVTLPRPARTSREHAVGPNHQPVWRSGSPTATTTTRQTARFRLRLAACSPYGVCP